MRKVGTTASGKTFYYDNIRSFGCDFVFRSLRDDEPAKDSSLVAKDPKANVHPTYQCRKGNSDATQWISATKSLGVALQNGVKQVVKENKTRPHIAIIDVKETNSDTIDFQRHPEWESNKWVHKFSQRSQEVLFERNVDKCAVVAIIGEKERKTKLFQAQEIEGLKKMASKTMNILSAYQKERKLYNRLPDSKREQKMLKDYKQVATKICDECDKLAYSWIQSKNFYMVDLIYEGSFNVLKDVTEKAINSLETVKNKDDFFKYEPSQIKDTRGYDYEPELEG